MQKINVFANLTFSGVQTKVRVVLNDLNIPLSDFAQKAMYAFFKKIEENVVFYVVIKDVYYCDTITLADALSDCEIPKAYSEDSTEIWVCVTSKKLKKTTSVAVEKDGTRTTTETKKNGDVKITTTKPDGSYSITKKKQGGAITSFVEHDGKNTTYVMNTKGIVMNGGKVVQNDFSTTTRYY